LSESCRLGPIDGFKSSFSASSSLNAEVQECYEPEMNRYYGLTEVDSSLQDAIVRMDYVQNVLSKITLTNKSAEFRKLLEDFIYNIEEVRLKLETMLSPFANLEQFSADLITESDHSTESTTSLPSRNTSTEQT
ncbi:unnamed protein product, partial [Litomosoides sigmodontis]